MNTTFFNVELDKRIAAINLIMEGAEVDGMLIFDADNVAYVTGYYNYLGMVFGRPTFVIVTPQRRVIVTPIAEAEMCRRMAPYFEIEPWHDGDSGDWLEVLKKLLDELDIRRIGLGEPSIDARAGRLISNENGQICDMSKQLSGLRAIKSPFEIELLKQAGLIAIAMAAAAKTAIAVDVPEYEIALAALRVGTETAAAFLADDTSYLHSPFIDGLPIMQSGTDTCMVHRRSSNRKLRRGDALYICFCGWAKFKNYKLGFDRQFSLGTPTREFVRAYSCALEAQQAALSLIRPGAICADVNHAAEKIYRKGGYVGGYRTGRAIGLSNLETPQLSSGDYSVIKEGMTFAVDGGIAVERRLGARIGDSVVVTRDGFEYLTDAPRELAIV